MVAFYNSRCCNNEIRDERIGFRSATIFLVLLLVFVFLVSTNRAQSPDQTPSPDTDTLLTQLGDPNYVVRDEAETKLLQLGEPAIAPLRILLDRPLSKLADPEVSLRATRLLILLERANHERKTQQFLTGQANDCHLVGWKPFSRIAGKNREARQLFVDMHQAQDRLMNSIVQGRKDVERAFADAAETSHRISFSGTPSEALGTLSAMLFVATHRLDNENAPAAPIQIQDVDLRRIRDALNHRLIVAYIESSLSQKPVRQLIANWLDQLSINQVSSVDVLLDVVSTHALTDKLDRVVSIASRSSLPIQKRIKALSVVRQIGGSRLIPEMENLMNDSTLIGNFMIRPATQTDSASTNRKDQKVMQVRFCDITLATALMLQKQKLPEYGYQQGAIVDGDLRVDQAGFVSETDRQQAFALWKKRDKNN